MIEEAQSLALKIFEIAETGKQKREGGCTVANAATRRDWYVAFADSPVWLRHTLVLHLPFLSLVPISAHDLSLCSPHSPHCVPVTAQKDARSELGVGDRGFANTIAGT